MKFKYCRKCKEYWDFYDYVKTCPHCNGKLVNKEIKGKLKKEIQKTDKQEIFWLELFIEFLLILGAVSIGNYISNSLGGHIALILGILCILAVVGTRKEIKWLMRR